jgi:hypothetical protein
MALQRLPMGPTLALALTLNCGTLARAATSKPALIGMLVGSLELHVCGSKR